MAENRFRGKTRMLQRMADIPNAVRADVRAEMRNRREKLAAAIKRAVPVDEGELKESIRTRDTSDATRIRGVITEGEGGQEEKARAQEFGRPDMAAQPHFFPTYRAHKAGVQRAVSRAARKGAKRAWETS